MNIEWKEGAVCFADGEQWYYRGGFLVNLEGVLIDVSNSLRHHDFQLNTVKQGDYIPKSELDTEDKYNRAVDVLEMIGVHSGERHSYYAFKLSELFKVSEFGLMLDVTLTAYCKRKITFKQLDAIGELKHLMNERPANNDQVKKPSHYQLIEGVESMEIIARSMTKEQWHGFCLGNMLKYRIRAGKKDKLQQDIDKANFYGELYEMHRGKCYDK